MHIDPNVQWNSDYDFNLSVVHGIASVNRRTFHSLLGLAALSGLSGCSTHSVQKKASLAASNAPYLTYLAEIIAREKARPKTGRKTQFTLKPQIRRVDLGGSIVTTACYGNSIPGDVLRARVGDVISADIHNELPFPTNIHWHGLTIRNDADLAPSINQPLAPKKNLKVEFTVTESGSYWIHPHFYMDTDYGMYAPLVIDDPREPQNYDAEWVVVLDDWTQGIGPTPPQIFQGLYQNGSFDACGIYYPQQAQGVKTPGLMREDISSAGQDMSTMPGMSHMPSMSASPNKTAVVGGKKLPPIPIPKQRFRSITSHTDQNSLRGDTGDVQYPYYLINGRIPSAPSAFRANPGQRIRIRIINASADTAYTVALANHHMIITHTDGMPIMPERADALVIGMGERYDAIITAGDGVFPLVARAEGKNDIARALLITGSGQAPDIALRPAELNGRKFFASQLQGIQSANDVNLTKPDTICNFVLGGGMKPYRWSVNDMLWPEFQSTLLHNNTIAQINFINKTSMWHPMHLHGHRMLLLGRNHTVINKDTILIAPMSRVSTVIKADNPGAWLVHCHNSYHMEAGMMSRLNYAV